jgi:hypothetical protein
MLKEIPPNSHNKKRLCQFSWLWIAIAKSRHRNVDEIQFIASYVVDMNSATNSHILIELGGQRVRNAARNHIFLVT